MRKFLIIGSCALAIVAVAVIALGLGRGAGGSSSATSSAASDSTSSVDALVASSSSDTVDAAATEASSETYASGISADEVVTDAILGTYKDGEVLITFATGTTVAQAQETVASVGTLGTSSSAASITQDDIDAGAVPVTLADGISVASAMSQLSGTGLAASVQPDYVYYLCDESGDSSSYAEPAACALSTTIDDTYSSKQWYLSTIDAYDAWDTVKTDGTVSVAVLDTGVNSSHEDLDGVIDTEHAYNAYSVGSGVGDTLGHGTFVCGEIAAEANNSVGIAGVSYDATIIPVKVFGSTGLTDDTTLIAAYKYVLNLVSTGEVDDLHVINMSLGGDPGDGADTAFETQIDAAAAAGIVTVCAAGNEGDSSQYFDTTTQSTYASYPSDYRACISVCATDQTSVHASYSSYDASKDISAPGTRIYSTYMSSSSSYAYMTGTSMAAPMVAGVCALLYAEDPSLTVDEVKTALYSTATDLTGSFSAPDGTTVTYGTGWDKVTGYGLVDAAKAVESIASLLGYEVNDTFTDDGITYLVTSASTVQVGDGSEACMSTSTAGAVTIPSQVTVGGVTYSVTSIGDYAFYGCTALSSATIPASVTLIGNYAFGDCTALSSVVTSDGGASIGIASDAFADDANLVSTITFDSEGGTDVSPITQHYGSTLTAPADPTRSGYTFAGWYLDEALTESYTLPSTMPLSSVTLYAKWTAVSTQTLSTGDIVTIVNTASGKAVEAAGASIANALGATMYSSNGTVAQECVVTVDAEGYCTFTDYATGRVLDVAGAGTSNGTGVDWYAANGTDAQKWTIGAGGAIVSKASGLALDVSGDSQADGASLDTWTANGTAAQAFTVTKVGTVTNVSLIGTFTIGSSLASGLVLDVSGASTADGANVQVWDGGDQTFATTQLSSGYYVLTNIKTGKVLDVSGAGTANGTNVDQYGYNGTAAQLWSITATSGGYTIESSLGGLVLDVSGAGTADGTNVDVWELNGSAAQVWSIG